MQKKHFVVLSAVSALAITASNACATAMLDLSAAATSITAEVTPALAAAIPIAGTLLAAGIGWKFFKRFVH